VLVTAVRVTVIGLGQALRGDDAAGIEAVRRWQREYAETASHAIVQYAELPGLALLEMLEGFEAAVIVDAVESAAAAGTVYRLGPDDLDAFSTGAKSAHGWGVAETLQLGRQLGALEEGVRIRLVGIAAAHMETGKPLSEAVMQALPAACGAIEAEVLEALG
jgi:hydrogenase maturation protease